MRVAMPSSVPSPPSTTIRSTAAGCRRANADRRRGAARPAPPSRSRRRASICRSRSQAASRSRWSDAARRPRLGDDADARDAPRRSSGDEVILRGDAGGTRRLPFWPVMGEGSDAADVNPIAAPRGATSSAPASCTAASRTMPPLPTSRGRPRTAASPAPRRRAGRAAAERRQDLPQRDERHVDDHEIEPRGRQADPPASGGAR